MDRLLCGDVGFGKTELAVRAAFRVVNGGGQVAVLVPTTVLADQHFRVFRERLAAFPVRVEALSRYTKGKREREAVRALGAGEVDIAIGTHRLLSKDVSMPKLGLLVIDEEQRFGVKHKEHFKKLRAEVDVLTLTATPIPRTLHMSMSGLRDISALTEPPPGRQDVRTVLGYTDDTDAIRQALLRERNRGGQVFFLHNRVQSIGRVARELAKLVPECSFAVGHGQMGGRELADVMEVFTRGDVDVLVATTIIENGIDIPAAGTILIDRADTFGLAELHQLRGRVGRGNQKSVCYLLVDRDRPLSRIARERLKALEEMESLGAGFQISMKDLELRGAGNLLGAEQSGHIGAVGYDMYCRLLKQTVERIQAGEAVDALPATPEGSAAGPVEPTEVELELGLRAFLPRAWIPESSRRLELLRRLDALASPEEFADLEKELRDRFGRVPDEALELLRTFALRARLARFGITRLSWRDDTWLLQFNDRVLLEEALSGPGSRAERLELRPVRAGHALLVVPERHRSPDLAVRWLEGLLKEEGDAGNMARGSPLPRKP